jgi:hypothetical protein
MYIDFSVVNFGSRLDWFYNRAEKEYESMIGANFLPETKLFYKISRLNTMNDEKNIERDDAQITGRTEGPFGSDDADTDRRVEDNKNRFEQENSANGLDSQQVRGGQDGRNNRGIGSTDMDSKNGVLRMGDMDNSTMEVTQEGLESAIADEKTTNTAMVDVTTSGPDDYGSADKVPVPNAQKAAKEQNDDSERDDDTDSSTKQHDDELAETGTDLNNKPTY